MKIYHNPRCTKSRETLQLLNENGVEPEVVEYLKTIPTEAEIEEILAKLNIKPFDLVRTSEPVFKEKFKGKNFNDHEWIKIMIEYPKLIQRPIVIRGNKAVLGRPPENVLELLN